MSDDVLLIDGLAFGAFPGSLAAPFADRIVALVHHPLALETGHSLDVAEALRRSETLALRQALRRVLGLYADRAGWTQMVKRGMRMDWGWARSAARYAALYEALSAR